MYEHLLHDLLKEVFSLGVRARLEHRLEVVEQREDVCPIQLRKLQVRCLLLQVEAVGVELLELILERPDVLPEQPASSDPA